MSPGEAPPDLNDSGWCFACGAHNPIGLRTSWELDPDGHARARFRPDRTHQGWDGIVHGGVLATLLDEAIAQRLRFAGVRAVTASLNIRYRSPAPTGEWLTAEAIIAEDRGRAIRLVAAIRGEDGTCRAEAEGTCVLVRRGERSGSG